ncbi:MAG: HD domain-containing protein [Bacilli bacterium]|nr:HD domain-containing protein [Bacilli bacterium]
MNKEKTFATESLYIKDERYRKSLISLVKLLPDYFFEVPASSTGKYHPEFSLGKGGLVRHTKAAVKIAFDLLNDDSIGNIFKQEEKDLMIVSLILHDGLKHGLEKSDYVLFDHPLIIGKFIKENKNKTEFNDKEIAFIVDSISSHMGPWNTNSYSEVVLPIPQNKYQKFIHMCDYLASRKYLDIKFKDNEIIE